MSYFCKMKRHGLDSTSWCKSQAVKVHDKLQQGKAWLIRIYLSVSKSSPVAVHMHSVYAKLCVVSIYSFPYSHLEFSFCWICSHSLFLLSVTWKLVIPTVYPKEQDNIFDPLFFWSSYSGLFRCYGLYQSWYWGRLKSACVCEQVINCGLPCIFF